jgi:hypothetical protein
MKVNVICQSYYVHCVIIIMSLVEHLSCAKIAIVLAKRLHISPN